MTRAGRLRDRAKGESLRRSVDSETGADDQFVAGMLDGDILRYRIDDGQTPPPQGHFLERQIGTRSPPFARWWQHAHRMIAKSDLHMLTVDSSDMQVVTRSR